MNVHDDRNAEPHPGGDDLEARLRHAHQASPSDARRDADLRAMSEAFAAPALSTRLDGLRRRAAIFGASLAAALLPVGTAVAAESALPGDTLYPVKRVVEVARAVVDPRIVAGHRVDELAGLLERDAPPPRVEPALDAAVVAVEDLDDPVLHDRLVLLADEAVRRTQGLALPPLVAAADPTLRPPRQRPDERPTRRPPASPGPSPTRTDPSPRPSPTTDRSPGATRTPSPEPTARPSSDPSPSPLPPDRSPAPDDGARDEPRQERHRAGDAGVVTIAIDGGVHLTDVEARAGWRWRADRSEEPRRTVVVFSDGQGRRITLIAVHRVRDGRSEVDVRVEETRTDAPDGDAPR